jgi:ABC-type nickel/cobalt efflux system permease component RcnA
MTSMPIKRNRLVLLLCAVALAVLASQVSAFAQAHPFNVGISEGGGSASGLSGWLLTKQMAFERMLSGAVRAAKTDGSAIWILSGLSFLYGVFHAAGPGHGKAVIASYMFANERALKRGVMISFLASALQGLVAIALVGILAIVFNATAQRMKDAARLVESLSYAGIALLGCWLIWRKGGAFLRAWLAQRAAATMQRASILAMAGAHDRHEGDNHAHSHSEHPPHATVEHVHGPDCGHSHAPDPATLGDRFSWASALMTVVAAGLRPCSGAILVLVFALAQGIFIAGVFAVAAMSLGPALITSGLASIAVLAGGLAIRISGKDSARGQLILHALETASGVVILVLGVGLFLGVTGAGA